MKIVVGILQDGSGSSSTRFALLVGLSCSAVLVLVRIGMTIAGQ